MNIFNQLKTTPHFTTNEKQIADYILEHPEDVLKMNARDLASCCYVSMATVYRLCEKLNLAGYSELKLQISLSYENYLKRKDFDFTFLSNNIRPTMKSCIISKRITARRFRRPSIISI